MYYQVPLSNCPAHPPSGLSAPEKLQVLLGTFGMEELTPLFLTAHVKSDDDYYLLRGLDERERLTVFDEQLRVLHVRRFQRWMLQFALKIIDLY
ncbi:hypothetical protein H0H87_002905 [Tephrocybe sp. NHM501043]|nr:hypothetical protein H0H87_002905 [Tephrocybe sp. NHM501043]